MDRIGVFGVSWREGGPQALAPFTFSPEERVDRLRHLARQTRAREAFYLATCNRVEVGLVGDGETPLAEYRPRVFAALTGRHPRPGEAERTLRAWAGEGAIEHVFLVAAGLDSARVGETEITGQVRSALELSRAAQLCGPRLELVLIEALRVAARVHTARPHTGDRVSIADIATRNVRAHLMETPITQPAIALVGVSPMTTQCARALAGSARIVIVNRSLEPAERLAATVNGTARTLAAFSENPDPVEAVVFATAATEPVLDRAALERLAARAPSGRPPLLVDLAVPPDVEPADAAAFGLTRLGMDDITAELDATRKDALANFADARNLVDDALISLRRRMADRFLGPMLAAIQRRYRLTALEGIERLLRKDLAAVGDAEKDAIRRWAETLARRFAHLPTEGIKALAFEQGFDAVSTFFSNADESLARTLNELRVSDDTP